MPVDIPERIQRRLFRSRTGCLVWTGAIDDEGYGVVWWEGRRQRVHRVLFKLRRGRWPRRDREILHTCDRPWCQEDRHHVEGTRRQNERDKHAKGRGRGHFVGSGRRAA